MKKLISILLAVITVFSLSVTAFAAESEVCPVIDIRGIVSNPVYADKNDKTTAVGVPSKERIETVFREDIVPALVVYSASQDTDVLATEISAILNTEFADWFNNSDGTPKGNSGAVMTYPSKVKKDSHITFQYDWRGDPMVIAAELDALISYVTEKSGCDKVAVTCHSLGSIVLVSYFSLYGDSKVESVVFDTPALMGLKSVGDALSGKLDFDGEALTYFLKEMLGESVYAELVASISDIFDLAGIPGMFSVFFDKILDEIGPVIYRETLIPLFGCWLTIWAMVPDEQIEEAMEYIFGNLCKDKDYSALEAKIKAYNGEIRKNKTDILLDFDKDGKVAVISRYGFAAVPVSDSWSLVSDGVIETRSSSLGATTAAAGDIFSDEYLEGKDMKYISPDKTVDASTCLFPEKTWFIKNAQHSEDYITKAIYNTFLFSSEELTTEGSELPQFSYYDKESGKLVEDTTEPEKAEKLSPMEKLFNFIKSLLVSIRKFFTGFFK